VKRDVWRTHEALDPAFERAWSHRLGRAPHANFSLRADYLRWEAEHGHRALACLIEEGDRAAALVLRAENSGWTSGWQWRWQAVMEDPSRRDAVGLTPEEAAWLFSHAQAVAEGRRLRFHLPVAPPSGVPGFRAATTLVQRLACTDEELLRAMHKSKRRMVQKAQREGYRVEVARTIEQFKAFWLLQVATYARHGVRIAGQADTVPGPGELWREWELPWMCLLIGSKGGTIETGSGEGCFPGGIMEGRTAATSELARKDGAYALVCYDEARLGRDRGHHWLNLGGDTTFKRHTAGTLAEPLSIYCWMAGGALGGMADHAVAWSVRARGALRALARRREGEDT